MNYFLIILFIISLLFQVVLIILRLKILYRRLGAKIKMFDLARVDIIVSGINTLIPLRVGNIVARPFFIKKIAKIPYKISLSVSLIEQLVDLALQILIVVICLFLIGFGKLNTTTVVFISVLSFILLLLIFFEKRSVKIIGSILEFIKRVSPKKLISLVDKKFKLKKYQLIELIESIQNKENKKRDFLNIIILSVILILYTPLTVLIFLKAFDLNISYVGAFIVLWLPFFLGRISGIPGGFGVREGSMILVLMKLGVASAKAIEVTILFRAISIAFWLILGFLFALQLGVNIFKLKKYKVGD